MDDWAFTNGGVAYNTGKPNRPRNQVIRVRLTSNLGSRVAADPSAGHLDTAVSKLEFSEREINYDEPRRATIELAIVVGECFENPEKDCINEANVGKPVVNNFDEFDEFEHACIETRETALVVRMVKDRMATFYVLKNKQHGLCEAQQLASIKRTCKFIAWYPEFVAGVRDVLRERQRKNVRDSIQRLRDELLEARTESPMVQAPSLHDERSDSNDGMDCDDGDDSTDTMDYDYGNGHDDCNDYNDNNVGPQEEAKDYSCSNVGP